MSNQDKKNIPCKSLPLEYMLSTRDKPMQSPVPQEVGRAFPMGQAAEPRNESVLQSFNLAKY